MKIDSFEKLFILLLSDVYAMTNFTAVILPQMARKAKSKDLKEALQGHAKEAGEQLARLEEIYVILDEHPLNVNWVSSIRSFFENAEKLLADNTPSAVLDAAIIAIVQKIEHNEIASYGTLVEFADVLEYDEVKRILKASIKEAGELDSLLNKLAVGGFFSEGINSKALALSEK